MTQHKSQHLSRMSAFHLDVPDKGTFWWACISCSCGKAANTTAKFDTEKDALAAVAGYYGRLHGGGR